MLFDSRGDALIDEEALPDPRSMSNTELTALLSAVIQVLAAIHGPEVVQLIAIRAEAAERSLASHVAAVEGEPYLPPADSDVVAHTATEGTK
jgi:hypothetical protein